MNFFPQTPTTNDAHIMVDIETLGTEADAAVLSIGAVLFNPQELDTWETLKARSFYRLIDIEDAAKYGSISPGTLKWWFGQSDSAIKQLVNGNTTPLRTALLDLISYGRSRPNKEVPLGWPAAHTVWAKSPDFDCTILKNACKPFNLEWPWPFWAARCVRTAQDLGFPNGDRPIVQEGTSHNARDDAIAQARMIQLIYYELGLTSS